ncbi:phosphate/phosphite/phosphonate ABC transporter substrate-binding protein [Alteromonas oceanisediminis]|uniref:phosphate/phosphite/phosphonate ABC transporter substrate-binding protein n=1 Tax=Alteromonas oceanisediminis TaxID=2836180 RepID=UPI001BD9D506|nr:PhnD/SsuA/transferrin family substrate-binding protein [Alteromonas oceanisediminis]MBT0587065.1 PhnD/SsuA/transferrin family substrate-binding protein [Alteromonas oceanisediminis]
MVLALVLLSVSVGARASDEIVIATYHYEYIDRAESVAPLAQSLSDLANAKVNVQVFNSPTDLATAFVNDKVDVAVPNLAGFAKIAASSSYVLLIVPDNRKTSYTSSIVAGKKNTSLVTTLKSTSKPVGMVWPDSSSGGLVGLAKILQLLPGESHYLKKKIEYLGSHQNVMDALLSGRVEVGVLATQVYESSAGKNSLSELWRSPPIPYGPIVCNQRVEQICLKLQAQLVSNTSIANEVLNGLKLGWKEFENSTQLIIPKNEHYGQFITLH